MKSVFFLSLFLICFSITVSKSQNIELQYVQFKGNYLVIHYDLLDSMESRFYSIRLYSSKDGFLNPLEKIHGDVGLEVRPGKDKIITWAFREELPTEFDGKISIEIRGKLFVRFINTESIDQYKKFKRKLKYNLTWTGGSPQNVLNFDLYRAEEKITSFPNLSNVGHHTFEFANYVKPGNDYRFKISDVKNREEVVFTKQFSIRRRFPLILKTIPVMALGYVTYLVFNSSKVESDIADAPVTP